MNVKVDIDLTPEEMRRLMGLPDVQPFHEDLVNQMRENLKAGAEGYDPLSLFKPYMNSAVNSVEMFQNFVNGVMGGSMGGGNKDK